MYDHIPKDDFDWRIATSINARLDFQVVAFPGKHAPTLDDTMGYVCPSCVG
jgi:hypothetical protein